jgi:hypothetical protein
VSRAPWGSVAGAHSRLIEKGYQLLAAVDTQAEAEALRKQQHVKFNGTISSGGARASYNCRRYYHTHVPCQYMMAVLTEGERHSVYSRGEHNHPLEEPPVVRSTDYTFCRLLNSREEIEELKNSGYEYTATRGDEENLRPGERVVYYRCVTEGCPRRVRLNYLDVPDGKRVTCAERAESYERGQHNHE